MKTSYITSVVASALLTVGLIPLGAAQSAFGPAQEGIEVITVVGKRPAEAGLDVFSPRPIPEGIEVLTVVGERPAPTVASTCVNEVFAARSQNTGGAASGYATRDGVRQAIRDCIEHAQGTTQS